ncbi:hypothetical protein SLE2022_017610 [Rubroshorea leprosula]
MDNQVAEPHEQRALNQKLDMRKERDAVEYSCIQGENDKGFGEHIHRKKVISAGKEQNMEEDSIEEERRTKPFWERLASDNEILQSRVERIVRRRKMERKKAKLKRLTSRRKAQMKLEPEIQQRKRRHTIEAKFQTKEGVIRANQGPEHSSKEEAAELWKIEKQLGLVDKNNTKEIIKRLGDMEKRDKITTAKQRLAE